MYRLYIPKCVWLHSDENQNFCWLFYGVQYLDVRWFMNDELENIWKEVVVV
jgi:hypothetical protein